MKPLYVKYETGKLQALLLFNLVALLASTEAELQASELDRLCVRLVRPKISGALLLSAKNMAGNYVTTDGDEVSVHLNLQNGRNRVTVEAEFGTNTRTLAIVDVFTSGDEDGVFEPEAITTPVVKQLTDVSREEFNVLSERMSAAELELAGKADGSIYRVGESGYPAARDVAKIYGHGLEVGQNAQATGLHAAAVGNAKATGESSFAHGYTEGVDSYILASGSGAQAHGYTESDGSYILASGSGAQAHGYTAGVDSYILASDEGAQAHGYTESDGSYIEASSEGAQAHGYTAGVDSYILASDWGAHAGGVANTNQGGYGDIEATSEASFAHGKGVKAKSDSQFVIGRANVVDNQDAYAFIVGNGTSDGSRSNAFAIDWDGNLVLFNNGTPVVLTPAKLAQLIA